MQTTFALFHQITGPLGAETFKDLRIVASQVATLEDGPTGHITIKTGQYQCTSTKITLKDKRVFIVSGDQEAAAIELKRSSR